MMSQLESRVWLRRVFSLWAVVLFAVGSSFQATAGLRMGDVVAICGDSITEQRLYSVFLETYFLACQPAKDLHAHQFGLSGETSWEFVARLDRDVRPLRPTVATTCYGMNDGGYTGVDAARQAAYRTATIQIIEKLKNAGVREVIVGSPGAVDTDFFNREGGIRAEEYNRTLRGLAEIAREVAVDKGAVYADVHEVFREVMAKAKAKHGANYHVAGIDGVHPASNGHLIIAYAFLKALGCDGNIGTIRVDLATKRASASEGHRVQSFDGETIEIESARYPFCFYGDPSDPNSARSILEFLPFNAELNRFSLIITGALSSRWKVSWGMTSKVFSTDELAEGINLAAEFPDNPFSRPFREVEKAVRAQQHYETLGIRNTNSFAAWGSFPPTEEDVPAGTTDQVVGKMGALEAVARAAVKPVQHTLKIVPVR
ncbi:MAG TPA: SGNH/GDSL hydrolase family protein [Terrimicrobiaceae bacterium]